MEHVNRYKCWISNKNTSEVVIALLSEFKIAEGALRRSSIYWGLQMVWLR